MWIVFGENVFRREIINVPVMQSHAATKYGDTLMLLSLEKPKKTGSNINNAPPGAGTPTKCVFGFLVFGQESRFCPSSSFGFTLLCWKVLNRANRRQQAATKTSVAPQPNDPNSFVNMQYSRIEGATPKHRKSVKLSNSAPNFETAFNWRAANPSNPSATAAKRISEAAPY